MKYYSKIGFCFLPLILLALVLGGCDEENPAGIIHLDPTSEDYTDAAEDFGAALADPNEGMLSEWMNVPADEGSFVIEAPGKPGESFICDTTFERFGLTFDINLTFYDRNGGESEEYNPLTTIRMTRTMSIDGTIEGPRRTATIDHDGFTELTGISLLDTVRTLTGNGQRVVESTFQARWRPLQRQYLGKYDWSIENFQFHSNLDDHPYPLDGTISTHTLITQTTIQSGETRTVEKEIEFSVYFDGTQYARIEVVDGPTYWVDLATGSIYQDDPNG